MNEYIIITKDGSIYKLYTSGWSVLFLLIESKYGCLSTTENTYHYVLQNEIAERIKL